MILKINDKTQLLSEQLKEHKYQEIVMTSRDLT